MDLGADLEGRVASHRGGDSPLPEMVNRFMEPRLARDLQRHTEEEAAEGIQADDEGNLGEPEDDELVAQRTSISEAVIQRGKRKDLLLSTRAKFDQEYNHGSKDKAVNILKATYGLDNKPYTLTVAKLPKASTHASTGGGWASDNKTFTPIRVRVNEPYLAKQAGSQAGFNKLIHTLGHEYQHVKQRSKKHWQSTSDASAKGEREFLAYSWEVLEAGKGKKVAILEPAEMRSTITKALNNYQNMSNSLQQKHKDRHDDLKTIELLNNW